MPQHPNPLPDQERDRDFVVEKLFTMAIKNIIFDLGGVVLGRDFNRFDELVGDCFAFLKQDTFPPYWHEFDRGTLSRSEVAAELSRDAEVSLERALELVDDVLGLLTEVPETVALIHRLKERGYRLYVLSNMPVEYWAHLRTFPVFEYFDGAVISSELHLLKPERAIYTSLLERYDLRAEECLFTDDKQTNLLAAEELGIHTILFADPTTTPAAIEALLAENLAK